MLFSCAVGSLSCLQGLEEEHSSRDSGPAKKSVINTMHLTEFYNLINKIKKPIKMGLATRFTTLYRKSYCLFLFKCNRAGLCK